MHMKTRGIVAGLASVAFVGFVSLQVAAQAQAPGRQAPDSQAPGRQAPDAQAPDRQAPDSQAPGRQAPDAQAPSGQAGQKAETARGVLKSVDPEKMTLTLASGETFQYNEQTKVTGAQGGVAGLLSMSGRQL